MDGMSNTYDQNEVIKHREKIADLETKQAIADVKLDAINQSILEIKNNHLLHINDAMKNFDKSLASIHKKITELQVTDAKREPGSKLWEKVVEYAILGGVGIVIALVARQ